MKKLTQQQLDQLTIEANEYMEETGRKKFPPAKADELRELGAKRCNQCQRVKNLEDFHKKSGTRDGLQYKCRSCNSAGATDHYQRNRDKALEYQREYKSTRYHNDEIFRLQDQLRHGYRRAVAAGNQADWITPEQLLIWWEAKGIDPLTCYLTGDSLTPFDRSIDHVVAIANGGEHVVENLMPCTWEANDKKRTLSPDDAREKLSKD